MATPASDQDQPSKMKKLTSGKVNDSIRSRLPHVAAATPQEAPVAAKPAPARAARPASAPAGSKPRLKLPSLKLPSVNLSKLKLLPAFWTFASAVSLTVNVVLLAILLSMWQRVGTIKSLGSTASDKASNVLGGLYTNFVKMDQATISTTIPVDTMVPLNIVVPVQTVTQITLAQDVVIPNAHVRISTGPININANAAVTLPANTPLMVRLDFPLTVQNSIPVHLDVPVNIPLSQTQLHEPFVGLQKVVEPWYCLVEPNASMNGLQVCPK